MRHNSEQVIGLASTSKRRQLALKQLPNVEVIHVGGGDESQTEDLVTIALAKIAFAYPTILNLCQQDNKALRGVLAADTNTLIGVGRRNKHSLAKKNKPKDTETVRRHFQQMSYRAQSTGHGYYEVASSSAFQDGDGAIAATDVTKVTLHAKKLKDLADRSGFAGYLETFDSFYGGEAYQQPGLSNVSPLDLSGGISLPVLLKMGAVEAVDGVRVKKDHAQQVELIVKKALLNVAVGFSPKVLERIHPQAVELLLQWSWLQKAAQEALSN